MASQQDPNKYSTQFPRLKAKAGDPLTAIYLENGHVTRDTLPPDMKPRPGTYQWVIFKNILSDFIVLDRQTVHGKFNGWFSINDHWPNKDYDTIIRSIKL